VPSPQVEHGKHTPCPSFGWYDTPVSHNKQPVMFDAPEIDAVPLGHFKQVLLTASWYKPVVQYSHEELPETLWPPGGHASHKSVAPMLNVFMGHFSTSVRCSLE
jgi:hypothetical protein